MYPPAPACPGPGGAQDCEEYFVTPVAGPVPARAGDPAPARQIAGLITGPGDNHGWRFPRHAATHLSAR